MSLHFYNQGTGEQADGRAMVWYLIIANCAVHLLLNGDLYDIFALHCGGGFHFWQLLTAGFLHSHETIFHLIFNMWSLYLFGMLVAPHIGQIGFLLLYCISVLAGNLLFLIPNFGGEALVVGASGAVFGVMAAAAMLEPDRRFTLLFLPFKPLRTTSLVICFAVAEIIFLLPGARDGVAHLAHLGGLVGGYLFIKLRYPRMVVWDVFRPRVRNVRTDDGPEEVRHRSGPVSSAELDALLDKISRYGINSLSEYELARLRQAREEMRGK
ncbi:MAG: rhomboid family intramembrane serine protease [Lentisphaeria bacterium]|nr:rhomboid family intramembrane serine protease [Lentisphaeria bacterium]